MTDTARGTFTSAHELLDRLRARQAEIGLSNEGMDDLCGFTRGQTDKYLGPARLKMPGLFHFITMLNALALCGELHVDPVQMQKMTPRWRTQGKRRMALLRDENPRVSQAMIKRSRPEVLKQAAQNAANARWKRATPAQRKQVGRFLVQQRTKQRART